MKTPLLNSRREFMKNSALLTGALWFGRSAWGAESPLRTIHPYPNKVVWGTGSLKLSRRVQLALGSGTAQTDLALLRETWRQFTAGAVKFDVVTDAALGAHQFVLGIAKPPALEAKSTYALRADATAVAVAAVDAASLRH
ncbi:MAG: hypothetical protein NTY53_01880, partial [Kiritimatiellaeota bacterium]|nr:hypothetical protein [Kiritimatiellota bacterium]